jgi:hypothetical protein
MRLSLSDREALTFCTWHELIEQAQNANTPYLQVAVTYSRNHETGRIIHHFYDALSLDHYITLRSPCNDPLNNLPIEKVEYRYIKISDFNIRKKTVVQLNPKKSVPLVKMASETICQQSDMWKKVFRDASDYHLCPQSQEHVTNCQYLFGTHLLIVAANNNSSRQKLKIALHWLSCAVKGSHKLAKNILDLAYENLFPKTLKG